MLAKLWNKKSRINLRAKVCMVSLCYLGSLALVAQAQSTDDRDPTVVVTAGDPGDLDVGEQATAPASATITFPPKSANESTFVKTWTWTLGIAETSKVYIDHPNSSSTTYHCEHDDPGDYSIGVSASVTLTDPSTGKTYGPYTSNTDIFGDTDPDETDTPPSTPDGGTPDAATSPAPLAHTSPPKVPKHYPVTLHFRNIQIGNPLNAIFTTSPYGHLTIYQLKAVLTKTGNPFTSGQLTEVQTRFYANPKYDHVYNPGSPDYDTYNHPYFSAPGPPGQPISHPLGFFSDTNSAHSIQDTTMPPISDPWWYSFDQKFTNTSPNVEPDNHFVVIHTQPIAKRLTIESQLP